MINGKLDRTALPLPDHKRPDLRYPYIPPNNVVGQKLVQIWEEVLDISPIGMYDNFLDLGGHSLLATRIISRVLDTFRVEVSLRSLYESATVADMALIIMRKQTEMARPEDLARMLSALEPLTDEEVKRLLAKEVRERDV